MARLATVALFAACAPGTVRAQYALEIPPDARSEGMGGAQVVLDPGPWAAWGNVGALGLYSGSGVVGTRFDPVPDYPEDVTFWFGSAALALPVGANRLVFNVNMTHVEIMQFSMQPYCPPPIRQHDDARGIAVAAGIRRGLGIGMGIKSVRAGFDSPVYFPEGRTTAFDFGILYEVPWATPGAGASGRAARWDNPRVGISASNLGAPMGGGYTGLGIRLPHVVRLAVGESAHFGSIPDPPAAARAAAAPSPRSRDRLRLTASVSAEKILIDVERSLDSTATYSYFDRHNISLRGGLEARFSDLLALRAGYLHDDPREVKGFTFGAGLSWHGWAGLDFASVPQYTELSRLKKFSAWLRVSFPAER